MMIQAHGSLLRTLSVAGALTLAAGFGTGPVRAQAQAARETPAAQPAQTGPLQSLMGLFQHEAQAQPINRDRVDSDALPPPGFATPDGGPPPSAPQIGHQFGAPTQAAAPNNALPNTPTNSQANAQAIRPPGDVGAPAGAKPPATPETVMSLPPEDQPEKGEPKELAPNLKRQLVDFKTTEPAGTIVVDTANTYLYLVLGGGKALRYGVRVGREGFTWTGTERISRMKEWPDWFPPAEMIERQPYLPRFMAGGDGNPLGARAMYLGKTLYRIHGTNQPSTIGHYVSSGCVGMLNDDVQDLYSRVQVGTRVVVLPGKAPAENVANAGPPPPANPMAPPPHNPPAVAAGPQPQGR
ncbi:MAG TPA: L,D-transpeptidase family protein [Pseudolabrys sp.]|nr:L,D-transpeptidase family protein [Pseudolabrys sp.]